jgi:hypothetical protein
MVPYKNLSVFPINYQLLDLEQPDCLFFVLLRWLTQFSTFGSSVSPSGISPFSTTSCFLLCSTQAGFKPVMKPRLASECWSPASAPRVVAAIHAFHCVTMTVCKHTQRNSTWNSRPAKKWPLVKQYTSDTPCLPPTIPSILILTFNQIRGEFAC